MRRPTFRAVTAGVAVAAMSIGGPAAISASASSAKAGSGGTAKIKMEATGKGKNTDLFFSGPKEVEKGAKLKVVNKTNPNKVGPHTFTLVKKNRLPKSKQDIKACEKLQLAVCENGAKAHEVDLQTFQVNRPKVEVGKKGWDQSFGKIGDSWYTETAGEHNTRKVSADDGKTLYYFCLVHPFMQGKIKVVK